MLLLGEVTSSIHRFLLGDVPGVVLSEFLFPVVGEALMIFK